MINGDICVIKLRHDEFIKEKLMYMNKKFIEKNDRIYLKKNLNNHTRYCEFIQELIIKIDGCIVYTKCHELRLINMDSFFYLEDKRRMKQLEYRINC
jgi:hypothetical protein